MGCVASCQAIDGVHSDLVKGGKTEEKQPARYLSDVTMDMASSFADLSDIDVVEDNFEEESDDGKPDLLADRTGDYLRNFHSGLSFRGGAFRIALFTTFELEETQAVILQGCESNDFYVLISSVASFKTKLCPDFYSMLISAVVRALDAKFQTQHSERANEWSSWDCGQAVSDIAFPRDNLPCDMSTFLQ